MASLLEVLERSWDTLGEEDRTGVREAKRAALAEHAPRWRPLLNRAWAEERAAHALSSLRRVLGTRPPISLGREPRGVLEQVFEAWAAPIVRNSKTPKRLAWRWTDRLSQVAAMTPTLRLGREGYTLLSTAWAFREDSGSEVLDLFLLALRFSVTDSLRGLSRAISHGALTRLQNRQPIAARAMELYRKLKDVPSGDAAIEERIQAIDEVVANAGSVVHPHYLAHLLKAKYHLLIALGHAPDQVGRRLLALAAHVRRLVAGRPNPHKHEGLYLSFRYEAHGKRWLQGADAAMIPVWARAVATYRRRLQRADELLLKRSYQSQTLATCMLELVLILPLRERARARALAEEALKLKGSTKMKERLRTWLKENPDRRSPPR